MDMRGHHVGELVEVVLGAMRLLEDQHISLHSNASVNIQFTYELLYAG